MVVVAIISILLMLLIPNIRAMREKAWSSHCQNNLRQYAIAMNQYMADHNGDFVYAGAGGSSAGSGQIGETDAQKLGGGAISLAPYSGGIAGSGGISGSGAEDWTCMIAYIPGGITIESLSDQQVSVRVCPAVMQQIKKDGNFFDPDSPNFKGFQTVDTTGGEVIYADFESDYDANDKLILASYFTTYAINWNWVNKNKREIPENVVAFIDWNARDGWGANLSYSNWAFNGTNSQGVAVTQGAPKWTNAWWRTEVGFHHLGAGNEYWANFVAMDGHVGWVSSNTISITNFTTGLIP